MKKLLAGLSQFVLMIFFILFAAKAVVASEPISLVGVVNSEAQIVTDDGKLYFIGASDKSSEVEMLDGKRVEVTGELIDMDGENYIEIEDYLVVE